MREFKENDLVIIRVKDNNKYFYHTGKIIFVDYFNSRDYLSYKVETTHSNLWLGWRDIISAEGTVFSRNEFLFNDRIIVKYTGEKGTVKGTVSQVIDSSGSPTGNVYRIDIKNLESYDIWAANEDIIFDYEFYCEDMFEEVDIALEPYKNNLHSWLTK